MAEKNMTLGSLTTVIKYDDASFPAVQISGEADDQVLLSGGGAGKFNPSAVPGGAIDLGDDEVLWFGDDDDFGLVYDSVDDRWEIRLQDSSCVLYMDTTGYIHYNPGSDKDWDIITVEVTGTPRLYWDESKSAFRVNCGLFVDSVTYAYSGVWVYQTNGIDFYPLSDTDCDLLTVQVTGTPRLYWDESGDSFRFTKDLWLDGGVVDSSSNLYLQAFSGSADILLNGVDVKVPYGSLQVGNTGVTRGSVEAYRSATAPGQLLLEANDGADFREFWVDDNVKMRSAFVDGAADPAALMLPMSVLPGHFYHHYEWDFCSDTIPNEFTQLTAGTSTVAVIAPSPSGKVRLTCQAAEGNYAFLLYGQQTLWQQFDVDWFCAAFRIVIEAGGPEAGYNYWVGFGSDIVFWNNRVVLYAANGVAGGNWQVQTRDTATTNTSDTSFAPTTWTTAYIWVCPSTPSAYFFLGTAGSFSAYELTANLPVADLFFAFGVVRTGAAASSTYMDVDFFTHAVIGDRE